MHTESINLLYLQLKYAAVKMAIWFCSPKRAAFKLVLFPSHDYVV